MGEYSYLSEKLDKSLNHLNGLLEEVIDIKIICLYNDKVLLDSSYNIPSIKLSKDNINNDTLKQYINEYLNVSCILNSIPFEYYNDYKLRYYKIDIDKEELLHLNSNYSFYEVLNISSDKDKSVIAKINL